MPDRSVKVKLSADVGAYMRSITRASAATERLAARAERFDGSRYNATAGVLTDTIRLDRLNGQLAAFDGTRATATATVNTRRSSAKIAALTTGLFGLGPAAIAGGAAATAGLAGLGSTLGVVAAGAGAAGLAFAGVGDALTAMNEYALAPTADNLREMNRALAGLSDAGIQFTRFIGSLRPELEQLQAIAQEGMLPGVEAGIRDMMNLMPQVSAVVDETSKAMGQLAAEAGAALDAPFWKNFLNMIAQSAGPTIEGFGKTVGNLATGLAGLQMAFSPLAQDLIIGLEQMSGAFAEWAKTVNSTQAFRDFVDYARQVGPQLVDSLVAVAGALGAIATAAAPLGGPALVAIEGIANAINSLVSIPGVGTTLVVLAAGLGAISLAIKGYSAAKASVLVGSIGGMAERSDRAARGIRKLGRAIPVLGAVLIGGAIAFDQFTIAADDAAHAIANGEVASEKMRQEFNQTNDAMRGWITAIPVLGAYLNTLVDDEADLNAALKETKTAMTEVEIATAAVKTAQIKYDQAVRDFTANSPQARDALETLQTKTSELEVSQSAARIATDRHTAAMLKQRDAAFAATQTDIAYDRALLGVERAQIQAAEAAKKHTEGSIELRSATVNVRSAALDAARAAGEQAAADAKAAGAANTHRIQAEAQKQELRRLADVIGGPVATELDGLASQIKTLPDGEFTVLASGEITKIGPYPYSEARARAGYGLATGGFVSGPGGPTSDSIPAMLSDGEYVVKARTVREHGPEAMGRLNRGEATIVPRSAGDPASPEAAAFRMGGLVRSGVQPYPRMAGNVWEATSGVIKPLLAAQVIELAKKLSGGDGLAWARTQEGKPYLWGGVGPSGYDCSGFMAAIMNVMDGSNPHSRRGSTATFPWAGMSPGSGPGLSIGSTPNTGSGIGHMAGTIAGVNVESSGGSGVRVGPEARGAGSGLFSEHAHYVADRGAVLDHGDQAWNLSGRAERVLSPQQTESFDRLVGVLGSVNVSTSRAVATPMGNNRDVVKALGKIEQRISDLERGGDINVFDTSGDPNETARATKFAIRKGR